jgi:rubrerythrin
MDGESFVKELVGTVDAFCATLDADPPAYCYVPLTTDQQRVMVMQCRLHNELRAADLYGSWLRSTDDFEVKSIMAQSAHEEMTHAVLLSGRIRDMGHEPFDYRPLPAQTAMFNALEGLTSICQRIAGFPMAGETVATYLTLMSLESPTVPDWIKQPYRRITDDEERHGSIPQALLARLAVTAEAQDEARRAVAMRLVLFRAYLDSLDRWVLTDALW